MMEEGPSQLVRLVQVAQLVKLHLIIIDTQNLSGFMMKGGH